MEVDITTSGTALNNVIVRNPEINDPSLAGKLLTFGVYAKGTAGIQEFKIRLKLTAGGTTTFPASSKFTLNTDYELYEFQYQMPSNTTDVQLQLIMGTSQGIHYFDDFSVTEQTLDVQDAITENKLLIYPNPIINKFNIESSKKIINLELYDLKGSHYVLNNRDLESFELPYLQTGTYFLRIYFDDQSNRIKQLLIN